MTILQLFSLIINLSTVEFRDFIEDI